MFTQPKVSGLSTTDLNGTRSAWPLSNTLACCSRCDRLQHRVERRQRGGSRLSFLRGSRGLPTNHCTIFRRSPSGGRPFCRPETDSPHRKDARPMSHEHRCRKGLHVIRDGRDRVASGGCRACASRNQSAYRRRCTDARRRLAAIEAALTA